MQYNPKLKKAIAEMKEIAEKYDVGAFIILADGRGFSEFLNQIDPSWSAMFIETDHLGDQLRFRNKTAEVGKKIAKKRAEMSYNMLTHITDNLYNHLVTYRKMKEMAQKALFAEDFPGDVTGNQEQQN